jgi:ABC-type sugar transport system substrate-binding protein
MRTKSGMFWRLLAVLLAITLVAAACGSDDDDDSASDDEAAAEEEVAAEEEAPAEEEMDDFTAAAVGAAGDPVELEPITVGYLQWVYADEAGKRIEDAAEDAVNFLGWDYITCDAGGDPAQMPVCGNQLLDQDIDVMLTDGIPEALITDVMERAASEGVPMLSAGGEVDPRELYTASYASDDTDLGRKIAEELLVLLPDGGTVAIQNAPFAWADKRTAGINEVLEGTNVEVIHEWELDPTDMVGNTEADVTTKMQQFEPDAFVIMFSVASIGAANAVGAAFPDGGGPLLLTYYANPTTVEDIRVGKLTAAADEKLEWQSWAQVDAVAQLFARGEEPSQERAPDYGGINFSVRQVVNDSNIPASGTDIADPDPPGDYAEFFRTKWCADFTNVAACS